MAKTNRLPPDWQMRRSNGGCCAKKSALFQKKYVLAVDGLFCPASLLARLKRDSRVARQESWFSHTLGLQIGTQFCPVLMKIPRKRETIRAGRHDWVFLCAEECVNHWFFDIYIQGSKYNFKS